VEVVSFNCFLLKIDDIMGFDFTGGINPPQPQLGHLLSTSSLDTPLGHNNQPLDNGLLDFGGFVMDQLNAPMP
jgi:Adaptin C-terminal domain